MCWNCHKGTVVILHLLDSLVADVIRYHYEDLVKDVASEDIIDSLFSRRALSPEDMEEIEAEKSLAKKVSKY